ncbi:unnamed protein product, partial [marine sediment metagenome]
MPDDRKPIKRGIDEQEQNGVTTPNNATCKNLYEITKKAVNEMKLEAEVEYVTGNEGMQKIIELGAMSSPVLAVNDHIAMTGFTPDLEIIKEK